MIIYLILCTRRLSVSVKMSFAHPVEQAVIFIYKSCEEGQRHKGKLTLEQCKDLIMARDDIIKHVRDKAEIVGKHVMLSYLVIKQVAEVMQSTGVFSMDGAAKILANLITIEKWVKERLVMEGEAKTSRDIKSNVELKSKIEP